MLVQKNEKVLILIHNTNTGHEEAGTVGTLYEFSLRKSLSSSSLKDAPVM